MKSTLSQRISLTDRDVTATLGPIKTAMCLDGEPGERFVEINSNASHRSPRAGAERRRGFEVSWRGLSPVVPITMPIKDELQSTVIDTQPLAKKVGVLGWVVGVVQNERGPLLPGQAAVANLAASVIRDFPVAMLQALNDVVQVEEVPAVDVVKGVKATRETGSLVSMRGDLGVMLCQWIPAKKVAKIDAAHANCGKFVVLWVAVLPHVGFA